MAPDLGGGGGDVGDYPRLEYRRADGVLVVRPLPRVLGPWDGADPPPAEATEFRDQLRRLAGGESGPLVLDLTGYESSRNWMWWLVPLVQECAERGLAVWVRPAVAEQLAVLRYDRLVPVRTTLADAMAALGRVHATGPGRAADGGGV